MLLIYVDKITARLQYTLDFIFENRALSYRLTNDWLSFTQAEGSKLVYSERFAENHFQLVPSSLLFEEEVIEHEFEKSTLYNFECLAFGKQADILASIFYVLVRYEEYTSKVKDQHDRFQAKDSLQTKFAWLEQAICDRWSENFLQLLVDHCSFSHVKSKSKPKLVPTFDIDNTYAFKWKDGLRSFLSKWRDIIKKDQTRIAARKTFLETGHDPYDTFDQIAALPNRGFETKVFWLVGDYARYDKNVSINNPKHRELVKSLSAKLSIGLHPSYESNKSLYTLRNEKNTLETILGSELKLSRQHFLKIDYPYTFQCLSELGFESDYSMGFHDAIGFRAGTARPHFFFNLSRNIRTKLLLHPFVYMDITLAQYQKLKPSEAIEKIKSLYEEVSNFGGDFVFLWHNESISEFGHWKNWKQVFDATLALN